MYATLGFMRKYRNKPTTIDGLNFDSKGEAARWSELVLMQKCGEIKNLRRQVTYPLVVNGLKVCSIIPDFVYEELTPDGPAEVVEDFKSPATRTPAFNIKAKLFKAVYGRDIILNDGLPATARRARSPSRRRRTRKKPQGR